MNHLRHVVCKEQSILKVTQHFSGPIFTPLTRKASVTYYKGVHKTFRQGTEVKIPVPWGHMAGVWWGPRDRQPLLALHGWQDNAFTWRPLVELLPPDLPFLALEFPGHGLSSAYPLGSFFYPVDYLVCVRRVIKHFGWKSVSLIGHSNGGITSFLYAGLYPEETDLLILLEGLQPLTTHKENVFGLAGKDLDKLLVVDGQMASGSLSPGYKESELLEKFCKNGSLSRESASILLERAAAQCPSDPSKFYFTRDRRLLSWMCTVLGVPKEDCNSLARQMAMPIFCMRSDFGWYLESESVTYNNITDTLKSFNKQFEFHKLPGTHHLHLNDATQLAPLIVAFLNKYFKT